MSDSPEVELVRETWEAVSRGDLTALGEALTEDAKWLSVWEGATNCEGRSTIVEIVSANLAGRLRGTSRRRFRPALA